MKNYKQLLEKSESRIVPFYTTKDRFEIYILLASDCKIDGYDKGLGTDSSIYFRFENGEHCKELVKKIFHGELVVNAGKVVSAIRTTHDIFRSFRC